MCVNCRPIVHDNTFKFVDEMERSRADLEKQLAVLRRRVEEEKGKKDRMRSHVIATLTSAVTVD